MSDLFGYDNGFTERKTPDEIKRIAIDTYKPVKVLLLFSGGHDSMVNSHISAQVLKNMELPFTVYHGDTTIGIPDTQQYVKQVCQMFGYDLAIRKPPKRKEWYDEIVKSYGFPGSNIQSHQFMYRRLKERALSAYVTHKCKSAPKSRECVLLLTGIRQSESRIRMGYKSWLSKIGSKVWCNPIFFWSEQDCREYMDNNDLPRNPVKDRICISGECLCGAFAGKEEWVEIQEAYPDTAQKIKDLHKEAIKNGFPWGWASGPSEWAKLHPEGQQDMFMCVGCESKRLALDDEDTNAG